MEVEGPSTMTPGQKRKVYRKRVVLSCTECSRRKQKCNREWPCNHCLGRRAAHFCRYLGNRPAGKQETLLPQTPDSTSQATSQATQDEANEERSSPEGACKSGVESKSCHVKALESLGYISHKSTNLIGEIESVMPTSKEIGSGVISRSAALLRNDRRRTRSAVLSLIPPRSSADFLVQFYIKEINWYNEMIYPPTFLERYSKWWSQVDYFGEDDIQFAALIARLCAHATQYLPNPEWPTHGIFEHPIDETSKRFYAAAQEFDRYQPRPPSLTRVQQLYFKLDYLRNRAEIKESWAMLAEAAKELQDIGLHLEKSGAALTEFDMEIRRRTFWCLYEWDRWMSSFLGRWPTIPDQVISISLPSDNFRPIGTSNEAPTTYTDRAIEFKLVRFLSDLKTSTTQNVDDVEGLISRYNERLQKEFIDTLPSAFRLYDPDMSFDSIIPHIDRKRALLKLSLLGVKSNIYRPYLGSYFQRASQSHLEHDSDEPARSMKINPDVLLNDGMEALETCLKLHKSLGASAKGFSVFSIIVMEVCCLLAMFLLSSKAVLMSNVQEESAHGMLLETLHGRPYGLFLEGLSTLERLAPESKVAEKCIQVLKPFQEKLKTLLNRAYQTRSERNLSASQVCSPTSQTALMNTATSAHVSQVFSTEQAFQSTNYDIPLEFSSFFSSPDMSWFLDGDMFADMEENLLFGGTLGPSI